MAVYAVLAMWLTRGTTLFVDGVDLFLNNRGLDPGALLRPLNGHLVLMERSVYAAGFAIFRGDYIVFRLVELAGALLAAGVLFVLVRRRVGPAAALAAAILVLFLGSAWEVTIVQDVMTNVFCAAAGLGAFLALERGDRRGDVAACLLLLAAIACWTLGVAFAIGAAVIVLLQPRARGRLWVAAMPLALYAAWLLWVRVAYVPDHGAAQNLTLANVLTLPNFVVDEAGVVAGAVAGLNWNFASTDPYRVFQTDLSFGYALAPLAAAALAIVVRRRGSTPMLWGALAALAAFWISIGLAFGLGRTPTTIRYAYPGTVLVLVIAAEAFRGTRPSPRAVAALIALTVFSLGANLYRLQQGASFFRHYSDTQRAQLTAMEVARPHIDPAFILESCLAPVPAGPYLAAVDRNGSPADTPSELAAQPESVREAADSTLASALGLRLRPPAPGVRPTHCRRFAPSPGGEPLFAARPPGILLRARAAAPVTVGRFADQPTVRVGSTSAERLVALPIPRDALHAPWYVAVANGRPVTVCEPLR